MAAMSLRMASARCRSGAFVASPGQLPQQQVSDPIQAIVKYLVGIQERPAE